MNSFRVVSLTSLAAFLALFNGCATEPVASSAKTSAAAPATSGKTTSASKPAPTTTTETAAATSTASKAEVPLPALAEVKPIKISAEAEAVVLRFTQAVDASTLPHQISGTTHFPAALASLQPGITAPKVEADPASTKQPPPKGLTADGTSTELIERDWTGLVLVPIDTSLAKAYTSAVRLLKVEAHPLTDGRVRIWTRVHNIGSTELAAEVACSFRLSNETGTVTPYFYSLVVPGHGYRDVFFVSPDGELSAYTVLVRNPEMLKR